MINSKNKDKILITGATGFLGNHITLNLLQNHSDHYSIRVVTRN